MRTKSFLILTAICFLLGLFAIALAQEKKEEVKKVEHLYVGAKKCEMCHKKDGTGPSWEQTKHAGAWDVLKPEQQKIESCKACHSTGISAKAEFLGGVQCEACHGPGSDYQKLNIMKDKKLAMDNGLAMPDEKTCLKCHNEKAPKECHITEKFVFAKMKEKGVHAMPIKEVKPQ